MTPFVQCINEAQRCSALFRLGRDVEAALLMVDVFEGVQAQLLETSPELQQAWTQLLMGMLACQEHQDWLGLADALQYEMVALLEAAQARR